MPLPLPLLVVAALSVATRFGLSVGSIESRRYAAPRCALPDDSFSFSRWRCILPLRFTRNTHFDTDDEEESFCLTSTAETDAGSCARCDRSGQLPCFVTQGCFCDEFARLTEDTKCSGRFSP